MAPPKTAIASEKEEREVFMTWIVADLLIGLHGGLWAVKEQCCNKSPFSWYFYAIYRLYLRYRGSYIGVTSIFSGPPLFPHGIVGIFISGSARIGRECVIFQQVTIGSNALLESKSFGAPTVGDSCYIGAGAKIIGNVKVGNNVRIGANAIVAKDVPDNSVVVMDNPTVIEKCGMDNRFYMYSEKGWYYECNGKKVFKDARTQSID